MAAIWTTEQVSSLSPDPASLKAGQGLAAVRKWRSVGRADGFLWGEIQGSGSSPYRTSIDLNGPTFKCSCPSRKFPCKHGLGLFLIYAAKADDVKESALPDWVAEWAKSRAEKAEKKAQKEQEKADTPVDEATLKKRAADKEKRSAERQKKVDAGMDELKRWLRDIVRQGLGQLDHGDYSKWDGMAARMVDTQTAGLSRLVKQLGGIAGSGADWQGRLLERLGRLHLILEAYDRIETFPAELQADIRALIGFQQTKEEILALPGVKDTWIVVGKRIDQEDNLRVQRTWLRGTNTGRSALVLSFAAGMQPLDATLAAGARVDAELAFYPSLFPLRALPKTTGAVESMGRLTRFTGNASIESAIVESTGVLARYPWVEQYPFVLERVRVTRSNERWVVRDEAGSTLPVAKNFADGWKMLGISGGHCVDVFGEWDGDELLPLSLASEDGLYLFSTGTN